MLTYNSITGSERFVDKGKGANPMNCWQNKLSDGEAAMKRMVHGE